MLTKSQARWFFFGGTAFFGLIFLALTIDTMTKVPAASHEDRMTPEVVRGKRVWEDKNCMGCHTLLGEGAYYAPELTKVYERRGEAWMRIFLKDPEAMFPGKRRMVKYGFTDAQIGDVIAFLKWVGEIDSQGFPPKPDIVLASAPTPFAAPTAPADPAAPAAAADAPASPPIFATVCSACHSLRGKGGVVGPPLDTVGDRYDADRLDAWLRNPQAIKPGTAMPNLGLDDATRGSLVAFLLAQHAAR